MSGSRGVVKLIFQNAVLIEDGCCCVRNLRLVILKVLYGSAVAQTVLGGLYIDLLQIFCSVSAKNMNTGRQ